jgi:hypothetical protein
MVSSLNVSAQTAPGTNNLDPALVNQLLQRIDQLEQKAKQVDTLEAEVKSLKAGTPAAPEPEAPIIRDVWPKIDLQVQGDVDFYYGKGANTANTHNTFFLGDLDPLITAKLSDKGQVLADFAITSDNPSGDGFNFDIERLYAEYDFNDYFNVQAGRVDTSIGWYNNVYHNGSYFQTTVDRPSIFDYEDNGGILPTHLTGLTLSGDIPSGSLNLHYTAQVGNGRDYDLNQPVFYISDNNDFKAVNVELSAKPDWLTGLQFGASAYHDTLTTPTLPHTDQLILTTFGVYRTQLFEWMTEGVFIRQETAGEARWTPAGYSQVSRKFGKFRPYVRMEWRLCSTDDPLWKYIGQNQYIWGPTIGVRYDFTPMMALKAEYEHDEQGGLSPLDQMTLQWTFRY